MPTDTKDFLKTLPAARRRAIKQRAAELRDEYIPCKNFAARTRALGHPSVRSYS
jgi:hypothetical protein